MGSNAGPIIPQYDKLVFHLDALNNRSHPGSGNTWYDVSKSGLAGTVIQGTASYVSGGSTSNVYFNGSTAYNYGASTVFDITPSITMNCIWMNRGWTKAWQALFSKGDTASPRMSKSNSSAANGWYALGIEPNTYWDSGIATSHEYDAWKMITCVFDQPNSVIKFYINGIGVSNATRTSALTTNTSRFFVGANSTASSRELNGYIAVLQFFNGVLNDNEIQKLFSSYKGRYGI